MKINGRFWMLTTLIVLLILCGSTMETHAKVVGYWSFNNSEHIGKDSSPNHNHGELKGRNTAKWVQGITRGGFLGEGGGLKLDGGSWLEVPHDESLNLKDQLTLMCWVKFADINNFSFAQRGQQQSLIWKSAPEPQVSYGLYVNRGQLELELPLYANNPGLLFSWLYVIDPKCRGQFINGIPDFPARCQRKFAFGLADSRFGNLGFRASMPGAVDVHAVHPTFFVDFFPIDNFLLDEDDQDFLKRQEQNFVQTVSDFMIGAPSNIYVPRIIRHFKPLDEIWFHFAAVANGNSIRLYVNGREKVSERQGSNRQPEPLINSQEPLMIGRGLNGTGFNGIIDEVIILDHALTEDEIKEAMELGKAGRSLDRFLFDPQEKSVVAPNSPQIYWPDRNTGRIQRTTLDGTHVEDLVTGLSSPSNIVLDVAGGKMYWVDIIFDANRIFGNDTSKIQRANLDGTNVETLFFVGGSLFDIALDVAGGKVYWMTGGKIQRANLDGTHVEDLVGNQISPSNIVLDVAGGKMYWGHLFFRKIRRANLDGTNVEDLVDTVFRDIALDVAGGKVYWIDFWGNIRRANLDGTHVEDLVGGLPIFTDNIALDVVGGKMYWADRENIRRANLDGTNKEDLVTGLISLSGIALDLSSAATADATVHISVPQVQSTTIGDLLTFPLKIIDGKNVAGYRVTVSYDITALRYVESANGDYLPAADADFVPPVIEGNKVTLSATSPAGESQGDGTLATLTFEVVAIKSSTLELFDVNLVNSAGVRSLPQVENTEVEMIEDVRAVDPDGKHYTKWGWIKTTSVFQNYPNPFNPETWIPYRLAESADVNISIYSTDGRLVRRLDLGHQTVGMYESRSRSAYWDGRNALGEPVASGVYFYTLTAGDFTATRKMLIRK